MSILSKVDSVAKSISTLIPEWLVAVTARLGIFFIFWHSVQTKIAGSSVFGQKLMFWNVTDSTLMLFEYEYDVPLLPPEAAAYLTTFAEFFLSLGILFGLLTRLSAVGLLLITLVIQFFVYPNEWTVHLLWGAVLLYLAKHGPGSISLDALIRR